MGKAIHTMIRVFDADKSMDFYKRAFGFDVADRFDFDSFSLVFLRNSETDFEIELTVNKDQKEPYDQGSAYGHLALLVDDLDAEHKRISDEKFEPGNIFEMNFPDGSARGFFVTDPDGYKVEVIERGWRFQNL